MGGPIPIALLFKSLPFPIDLFIILGLWAENEEEGVAAEGTSGVDDLDDCDGDPSIIVDESLSLEGILL